MDIGKKKIVTFLVLLAHRAVDLNMVLKALNFVINNEFSTKTFIADE